jgi:carbamoyl-phosphate synthase large subunit
MPKINVLLTCIGGFFALDIVDAIRMDNDLDVRIVGVDGDPDVVNRHFLDTFYPVPLAATAPDDFVSALLEICRQEAIDIVLPGADEEVWALSRVKDKFLGIGTKCAVQDSDTVELIRDKVRFFETASQAGVSVPGFAAVSSTEEFVQVANWLGYPDRRVVLKPRTGRGARGVIIVDPDAGDLTVIQEARGFELGSLDQIAEKLDKEEGPLALMAMEFLPGDIYDVDCLADEGVPKCVVPRRRLWGTPFSRGVEGHQIVRNEAMEQVTRTIAETLSLSYVFDCDFGTTADGLPGLLEINPRWSGSVTAAIAGGVNLPSLLVRSMAGLPVPTLQLRTGMNVFPVIRMAFQRDPHQATLMAGLEQ